MLLGLISDTHDRLDRTKRAIELLCAHGAEAFIHCGDILGAEIVRVCAVRPLWLVFGNNDSDAVPELRAVAEETGSTCLEWGGVIELGGKRLGITHGHMRSDLRRVLTENPDYLFSGHSHILHDQMEGTVRRINPGALHRADSFSVALLDLTTGELKFLPVGR